MEQKNARKRGWVLVFIEVVKHVSKKCNCLFPFASHQTCVRLSYRSRKKPALIINSTSYENCWCQKVHIYLLVFFRKL